MKSIQSLFTRRALLVGLIAASGVLAASAYAMTADGADGKPGCEARHGQSIKAKWDARRGEHLAALKDKLKLAPEQEAAWQSFAEAGKPGQMAGMDRRTMREDFDKMNTPQRMDRMLELSDARRAHMQARAEAAKALYAQLTPEQQAVFDAEAMPKLGRAHRHAHHGHHQS